MLRLSMAEWVALVLVIIGALNWGLVGVFNGLNIVDMIFGEMSTASRVVYALVGIAALYFLLMLLWRSKGVTGSSAPH